MIWLNRGMFALNLIVAAAIAWIIFRGTPSPTMGTLEYKDFISILLTAITVVLAALAILLALAAIWGYQKLADHAGEKAAVTATDISKSYLTSDAFFARVNAICATHIQETHRDTLADRVEVNRAEDIPENANTAGNAERAWQD